MSDRLKPGLRRAMAELRILIQEAKQSEVTAWKRHRIDSLEVAFNRLNKVLIEDEKTVRRFSRKL